MSRRKRALDILIVLLAAPAASLIVIVAGLAVLASCGRPVFFFQRRVGLNGKPFSMIKLRTMRQEGHCREIATQEEDTRITPLGKMLRQYRIDELPQLVNVLWGDMSIIGPRPEQPVLVDQYRKIFWRFDDRHLVKPGITGLAQVRHGYAANASETRRKLSYDLFYVSNASMGLEARIVFWTIGTVLRGSGAR